MLQCVDISGMLLYRAGNLLLSSSWSSCKSFRESGQGISHSIILVTSWAANLCCKICLVLWGSGNLVYDELLILAAFKISLHLTFHNVNTYNVSQYDFLGSNYLRSFGPHKPACPFCSPFLANFSHYWLNWLSITLFVISFWDSHNIQVVFPDGVWSHLL